MKTTATAAGLTVSFLLLVLVGAGAPAPALAQDIQVNSADPASAPQGTVNLNVTIKGKGFKRGAGAQFFVTGMSDSGGITVNSTSFVSQSQLVANIDIADNAEIAKFDIQVKNADGRTGKGTELFAVVAKGQPLGPLARADFRDYSTDRIRSDGVALPSGCQGADYADFDDPCGPGHQGASTVSGTGMYFLRTLYPYDPSPTRWAILDFSQLLGGSSCPGLDSILKAYSGRDPAAFSPEDTDPCTDFLEVRFLADKAYAPGAAFTPVRIYVDAPDLVRSGSSTQTRWNTKYTLEFVNPLTITPPGAATITLDTIPGLEQAELWTLSPKTGKKETLIGTYSMPFQLTITRLP